MANPVDPNTGPTWFEKMFDKIQAPVLKFCEPALNCWQSAVSPSDFPTEKELKIEEIALKVIKGVGIVCLAVGTIGFAALECMVMLNPATALVVLGVAAVAALTCLIAYQIINQRLTSQLTVNEERLGKLFLENVTGANFSENQKAVFLRLKKFEIDGKDAFSNPPALSVRANIVNTIFGLCTHLESLSIANYDLTEVDLGLLQKCKKLKSLNLDHCPAVQENITHLKDCAIKNLRIVECPSLKPDSFLQDLSRVEHLTLDAVDDGLLENVVAKMPSPLESLTIVDGNLTGTGFKAWHYGNRETRRNKVKRIYIGQCPHWQLEGFKAIREILHLERVAFNDAGIDIDATRDPQAYKEELAAFERTFKLRWAEKDYGQIMLFDSSVTKFHHLPGQMWKARLH